MDSTNPKNPTFIPTGISGTKRLAVSGNGRRFAIANAVGSTVILADSDSGATLEEIKVPGNEIADISLNQDGTLLGVIVGNNPKLAVLLVVETTGHQIRWSQAAPSPQLGVLFNPTADRISFSKTIDRKLYIKTQSDGRLIAEHAGYVTCQALSHDGKKLAMGEYDGTLTILDALTGAQLQRGKLHTTQVKAVAWTRQDSLITVGALVSRFGDPRRIIRLWDAERLTSLGHLFGLPPTPNPQLAFDPETGRAITVSGKAQLWNIPLDLEIARLDTGGDQGFPGCFLSNSLLLLTQNYSMQFARLDDPPKLVSVGKPFPPRWYVTASHWPSDLLALASRDPTAQQGGVRMYSIQGSKPVQLWHQSTDPKALQLDFSPDGDRLLGAMGTGQLELRNTHDGELIRRFRMGFTKALFANNHDHILGILPFKRAEGRAEDHLVLLDGCSGKTMLTVTNDFRLETLAVSIGNHLVAVGGAEQVVNVYDANTLALVESFRAHDQEITALAFHPKLAVLASGAADGIIKLWDARTGRLLMQFWGQRGATASVVFSPDGRKLASGGLDRTIRVFDISAIAGNPASIESAGRLTRPE